MAATDSQTAEEAARRRARYLTGLIWHTGAFVIINALLWLLDAYGPGGVNWATWITAFWGFALAFHALAYIVEGRGLEARKRREYYEEERQRETMLH